MISKPRYGVPTPSKTTALKLSRSNELTRLSPEVAAKIFDAIAAINNHGMPHVAANLYPVIHGDWPSIEQDALERLYTVEQLLLLGNYPRKVVQEIQPLLNTAAEACRRIK